MSRHFFSGGMMPSDDLAAALPGPAALLAALALGRPALREDRQRLAREPRRAPRRRRCRCSRRPTARPARRSGCSAGASSSWPAPSCSAIATDRSGGSATTCSSARRVDAGGVHQRVARVTLVVNVALFQAGWFACVLGAAHGLPWIGVARGRGRRRLARRARRAAGDRSFALVGAAAVGGRALRDGARAVRLDRVPRRHARSTGIAPYWMVALWATLRDDAQRVAALAARRHRMARGASRRESAARSPITRGARLGALEFTAAGAGARRDRARLGAADSAAAASGTAARRLRATMNAMLPWLHALAGDARRSRSSPGRSRPLRRNVGLVDIFWSLFFLARRRRVCGRDDAARDARGCSCSSSSPSGRCVFPATSPRATGMRRKIVAIARSARATSPGFAWKSLYLVFGLQALLAWLISAPLAAAIAICRERSARSMSSGAALAAFGIAFEALADAQLARFKARAGERRPRHGPRAVALQPASELLRRILRLVGPLRDRARRRRVVDRCSRRSS